LAAKTRLAVRDVSECEEAIFEETRQKRSVLQVFSRLSLRVQHPLDSLDDVVAMSQEDLK